MPSRSVSNNSLIIQEILHSLKQAPVSEPLMMIKLDMKRAYDCI